MLDFSVTFFITIFNIVLLAFVLRALLFKPVSRFMAERAKRVTDSIEAAKADREEAQQVLEEYRRKLVSADSEAAEIIEAARKQATLQAASLAAYIVASGKSEAESLVADARIQIEAERKKAFALFAAEAAALVMAASSRLVRREFSGEDSRRHAEILLDELAATGAAAGGIWGRKP